MRADVSSMVGKFDAIASGFTGDCVVTVRALCKPQNSLVEKHPAIAQLHDLHRYLAEYFSWMLTADADGVVSQRMERYSFVGELQEDGEPTKEGKAFLRHLLKLRLSTNGLVARPLGRASDQGSQRCRVSQSSSS